MFYHSGHLAITFEAREGRQHAARHALTGGSPAETNTSPFKVQPQYEEQWCLRGVWGPGAMGWTAGTGRTAQLCRRSYVNADAGLDNP